MIAKDLQDKEYMRMFHGKVTDTLAILYTGSSNTNKLTRKITVNVNDVEFKLSLRDNIKGDDTRGLYYVSTHKLLSVATILLCAQNNENSLNSGARTYEVVIPLRDYAVLCGYNIREDGATKEDKIKEKNVLKEVRKKVHRDLDILFALEIGWKEKIRGKWESYLDLRLVSECGIKSGNIIIEFSQKFGDYLIQLPITQYPLSLLKVDERSKNAYSMGLKMDEHANMDSNIRAGTANVLKVSALLSDTNLPHKDDKSVKKVGWRDRIKKPFENSLDALIKCGLLQDWEYCHSKGKPLTNEEADFKTFEEWNNLLVHFTLKDPPDHTARLQKKDNEKIQQKKTQQSNKQKTGKNLTGRNMRKAYNNVYHG